jgi:diketogulonate reductase-like aldo/keto reductase
MYASSEAVVGDLLQQLGYPPLFSATKVWTIGEWSGRQQAHVSRQLWGVSKFDLLQIHNMLDWRTHLKTLQALKGRGELRYIGITTSHGAKEDEMARAIVREPFDFVQFTYSFADRSAEKRLLPLAAEHAKAVIVNRPFDGGDLFARVAGKPLPAFAREIDCANWAQFFLKFVVSHPAVTCAIPATSNAAHMDENMGACAGRLPDAEMRARMIRYVGEVA